MASAARSSEFLVITIDADYNHRMDRRRFLARAAAGAVGWVQGTGLRAQTSPAVQGDSVPRGQSPLGISDDGRDGVLFVPASYRDTVPAPLLVMLHGYGGWADEMKSTFSLAEEFGVVVIAPESRDVTWGRESPGFDEDVRYIGAAYRKVTKLVNIDPARVGLGGRSDGAGYALTMGLAYGDIFNHLIVIAGGRMNPIRRKGKPKIFIAHGTDDQVMPIELSGRPFAARLKEEGYEVTYREYEGGHLTPPALVREAFVWLVGREPKSGLPK
jgi:phospholipase/carboxylesterase